MLLYANQFEKLVIEIAGSSRDAIDRVESLEIGIEELAEKHSNFRQGDYTNEPEFAEDPEFALGMLCELRVFIEERYESDGAVLISWEIWSDDPTLDKDALIPVVENWLADL